MIETAADEQTARETTTTAAPGGQPRFGFGATANTLLGYTLVKGLQMTLHNLIFPLYAYSLGYNQETIGRLNATGALMVLLASVPLGMLADRIGRARLLAISGYLRCRSVCSRSGWRVRSPRWSSGCWCSTRSR